MANVKSKPKGTADVTPDSVYNRSKAMLPFPNYTEQIAINKLKEDIRYSDIPKDSIWAESPAKQSKHVGTLPERMKMYAEISSEELDKLSKEVIKNVANKSMTNDLWDAVGGKGASLKTKKLRESTQVAYGGSNAPLSSSVPKVVSGASRVKSIINANRVARIISKSIPVVSKIARNPIVRVAGRALEAGALGASAYDVGKSGLELYSEAKRLANRPTKLSGRVGVKVPLPKVISSAEHEYKSFVKENYKTQAQRNTEAGKRLTGPMVNEKPKGVGIPKSPSKLPTKRLAPTKPTKSRLPTKRLAPTVIPKRPEQIISELPTKRLATTLSFLHPLQIAPTPRVSPVRPIATRVQIPEEFMGANVSRLATTRPSMSLATLPKINRYKLGVQR